MANTIMIGAMAGAAMLLTGSAEAPIGAQVQVALQKRLPKTKVDAIDCSKVDGLCEVVAGANLFYVDKSARYLVIGRVYDMETRQDLTAAKLLALNPDMLVGGAAKANATADAPEAGAARAGARVTTQPAVARTLDVTRLSSKGAIVWGSGTQTVTVFSDFHCGYCRALSQALETMNVRVIERPISVLGSREIAEQVLCARDRHAAVRAAYAQNPVPAGAKCDTSGLDENEAFA
ncbi:DsbC family protein, partial [Sphingomonas sp. DC4000-5]